MSIVGAVEEVLVPDDFDSEDQAFRWAIILFIFFSIAYGIGRLKK